MMELNGRGAGGAKWIHVTTNNLPVGARQERTTARF